MIATHRHSRRRSGTSVHSDLSCGKRPSRYPGLTGGRYCARGKQHDHPRVPVSPIVVVSAPALLCSAGLLSCRCVESAPERLFDALLSSEVSSLTTCSWMCRTCTPSAYTGVSAVGEPRWDGDLQNQLTGMAAGACLSKSVAASAAISTTGVPYAKYVGGSSRPYIEAPAERLASVQVRVCQSGSRIR